MDGDADACAGHARRERCSGPGFGVRRGRQPALRADRPVRRSKRVLVLGDAMLDSYLVGDSTRLCQEAPVPVVPCASATTVPGGAANTAVNLAALGCQVELLSVVGADQEGRRLSQLLAQRGVGTGHDRRLRRVGRRSSKHRVVNGDRLVARFDQGDTAAVAA